MATNFNVGLNVQQINYFEKKIVKRMRVESLADQLASEGGDAAIHRVTDLKNTTWGYKAIMTMVPDDTSFGVVGDNRLQDHEAGITAYDLEITFDQFRKAFKNEGVMADRSVWFKFAQQASDQLAFWAKDTKDRLMMNTLAGVGYEYEVDGSLRSNTCEWKNNRFAGDVTAPSANRHLRWDVNGGTKQLIGDASTDDVADTDLPSWNMFLDMRAELPLMRVKPIRGKWGNGQDLYIAIVHPRTLNVLKKDSDFIANLRYSMPRGKDNPVFRGAETYMIDGILLISHRYAYNTLGAASGSKWGSGGLVNGARTLFLGAQALGMVEIGGPKWVTRTDDFENQIAISMAYKFGFRKTVWPDQWAANAEEDFGVVCVDHAIPTGATSYTV
jgi:N4-gp56 family major capsid protein